MCIFVEIINVMTIEQCIINYLASHRRVTVPGLGTFIVNSEGESNELLFSEFLKDDDGVLRGLLCADGASEIEAVGAIDRLIFEVRHATSTGGGSYILSGMGQLVRDELGSIIFVANEDLRVAVEAEAEEQPITNSVSQLFERLNEQQSEREEVEKLFSDEDRKESKRVTQSGRKIYNAMWIAVPMLALMALIAFVGYVIVDQWRLGLMEFPAAVESIFRYLGINRVV